MIIHNDFQPKRKKDNRLPPGQYSTEDFPILSLGPTPDVDTAKWQLEVSGLVERPTSWTWKPFVSLPTVTVTKDIHCVTKWSKFDTIWTGVPLDTIMEKASVRPRATHLIAHSYDGYTTNIPLEDITNSKAIVALLYEGEPITSDHGGPARLLVPHLYFWKSAKWLRKLEFTDRDIPGFWETRGYHNYGNPWKEERYSFD
jgi:DMSO/TMAO reductase YedYZ molybdopterin-dependent catalytic subunit